VVGSIGQVRMCSASRNYDMGSKEFRFAPVEIVLRCRWFSNKLKVLFVGVVASDGEMIAQVSPSDRSQVSLE
jgi:hypothetical protein